MADSKISALTALAGASVETNADVLPIVDNSTTTTKKILVDELAIALSAVPATQAQQETGTSVVTTVTPGRQHFHPSAPKCWAHVTVSGGTPTLAASYNITSITDTGTGQLTVTIATDFSSAAWCAMVSVAVDAGYIAHVASSTPQTAGAILLECEDSASTLTDPVQWNFMGLGDLA